MAETFLRAGASVLLSDLNDVALRGVVGELQRFGKVVHLAGDVSVEADVQRTVDRCVAEFGTVDVLVNNAGITRDATMRRCRSPTSRRC
jgi:3-oxoacyl-[acyl-carrier protein] reductase